MMVATAHPARCESVTFQKLQLCYIMRPLLSKIFVNALMHFELHATASRLERDVS